MNHLKNHSMAYTAMVLLFLLCLVFTGCGASVYEKIASFSDENADDTEDAGTADSVNDDAEEDTAATICVYVCGAVEKSGVYELHEGARAYEAIEMAGGMTEEADPYALNQAEVLKDGQQLTVYAVGDSTGSAAIADGNKGKININTATADELMTLPGIGESRAKDIITFREQNGPFEAVEDLMKISGIKNALFGKIENQITV